MRPDATLSRALGGLTSVSTLARASLRNTWRGLAKATSGSLPFGFLIPCSISMALLMGCFVENIFSVNLRSSFVSDPASEAWKWILFLGSGVALANGLGAVSAGAHTGVPATLGQAPLARAWLRLAWRAPFHLAGLALAVWLAVPTGLALGGWLNLERALTVRLVLVCVAVWWSGGLLGFAIGGLLDTGLARTALRRIPYAAPLLASTLVCAACAALCVWVRTSPAPWFADTGRALIAPGPFLPPAGLSLALTLTVVVGVSACLLREAVLQPRAASRRTSTRTEWRLPAGGWVPFALLDLRLWCRERQGLVMAVLLQLFLLLLSAFCAAETASEATRIGQPLDSNRYQELTRYLMPVGWAFFTTLSFGLTYSGGRQLMSAPIDIADVVWGKFVAALCFTSVQCVVSALAASLVFGSPVLPPGATTIAGIYFLASAATFVAGVLIPVDRKRLRGGLGALSTSMLAIFLLLVCLTFVLVPARELLEGARERSLVQVVTCFGLGALLLIGACRAGRTYGLAR